MSTSVPSGYHTCSYCGPGVYHNGVCPRVASIEYHPNGAVAKVTFKVTVPLRGIEDGGEGQEGGVHYIEDATEDATVPEYGGMGELPAEGPRTEEQH